MTMYRDQLEMQAQKKKVQTGDKNWLVTCLLVAFMGTLGIHRFYTGYTLIGVLQLFTLGGCGIWAIIDYIMIMLDNYKDSNGRKLADYNGLVGGSFPWLADNRNYCRFLFGNDVINAPSENRAR